MNKILILFCLPIMLFGQEGSVTLFNHLDDGEGTETTPKSRGFEHTYLLEKTPCYGFIFDKKGNVWYRDYCPFDYLDVSKFGIYSYKNDTISIVSSFIEQADRIHSVSIKEIEPIDKDTFCIKLLNNNGVEEGVVFSMFYLKYPKWPWRKEKSINFRRTIDWENFPKKIYVKQIWVSGLNNQPSDNGIGFTINEKWETKNKGVKITLFGESLKIVKREEEIILLKWNRVEKKFIVFDKLKYRI